MEEEDAGATLRRPEGPLVTQTAKVKVDLEELLQEEVQKQKWEGQH